MRHSYDRHVDEPAEPGGRPAAVVDYDPVWPATYERIAAVVDAALDDLPHAVEHVGSTAVPGLAAKPIIDLFAVVETAAAVGPALARLGAAGWDHEGDGGMPGRECFRSRPDLPYHHLYLVVRNNEQYLLQTRFRDILRAHPDARDEYAILKRRLAPLLTTDRVAYTEGKTELVAALLARYG